MSVDLKMNSKMAYEINRKPFLYKTIYCLFLKASGETPTICLKRFEK